MEGPSARKRRAGFAERNEKGRAVGQRPFGFARTGKKMSWVVDHGLRNVEVQKQMRGFFAALRWDEERRTFLVRARSTHFIPEEGTP
jgi:hypothetical protein